MALLGFHLKMCYRGRNIHVNIFPMLSWACKFWKAPICKWAKFSWGAAFPGQQNISHQGLESGSSCFSSWTQDCVEWLSRRKEVGTNWPSCCDGNTYSVYTLLDSFWTLGDRWEASVFCVVCHRSWWLQVTFKRSMFFWELKKKAMFPGPAGDPPLPSAVPLTYQCVAVHWSAVSLPPAI